MEVVGWGYQTANRKPGGSTLWDFHREFLLVFGCFEVRIPDKIDHETSHPPCCKYRMLGLWKPLQKGVVSGTLGSYKKPWVLTPTSDSRVLSHFVRWQLSSWFQSCRSSRGLIFRSCRFTSLFLLPFCKDTPAHNFLLFPPELDGTCRFASCLFVRIFFLSAMLNFWAWKVRGVGTLILSSTPYRSHINLCGSKVITKLVT